MTDQDPAELLEHYVNGAPVPVLDKQQTRAAVFALAQSEILVLAEKTGSPAKVPDARAEPGKLFNTQANWKAHTSAAVAEIQRLRALPAKAAAPAETKPAPAPAKAPAKAPAGKTLTRDQFAALPHGQRNEFFRNGGKLIDGKDAAVSVGQVTAESFATKQPTMTRAEFQKLPHGERSRAIRECKLID